MLDTTELLCALMKEKGITRKQLADMMGTSKGNITQLLSGARNLTIRTVSDVMTYLGHEFRASCKAREKVQSGLSGRLTIVAQVDFQLRDAGSSQDHSTPTLPVNSLVDVTSLLTSGFKTNHATMAGA